MKAGDWVELDALDEKDIIWHFVEYHRAYRITDVSPDGELFVAVPGDPTPWKPWARSVWKRTNHPLTELFKKHYESR